MSSSTDNMSREATVPFLVKLFHRDGVFYRPEEFASSSLPSHISIYTWSDCTLNELALELAASRPSALPSPAIGTRLAFQLVCPDLRGTSATSTTHPRFMVKDLGSIVIGGRGPGLDDPDEEGLDGAIRREEDVSRKTLADARFVVGDYISCAIFPPLADGSIAPASSVKRAVPSGREARGGFRGGMGGREAGFGRSNVRPDKGGRSDSGGFPMGEWRRGETLPEGPPRRSRGRGRW